MRVESSDSIRGRDVVRLGFDIRAGVGPVRVVDRTGSWLDVSRMASLRFFKHERNPLWSRDEKVELYPDERRWRASDGSSGESATDAPLDELSFIYFLRTLNLNEGDTAVTIARHFAADRNPTVLRVRGREAVETRVGTFATILIEMRVTDPRRYRGEGVILVNLSDDACRLPVRVRSAMPVFGTAVLTLESHTHATGVCGAQSDPRDSPR